MRKRSWMIGAAALAVAAWAMPAAAQYYGGQGYDGYGSRIVRCESNDGRVRECATGGGRVVLERQHSQSPCIEGRSWGYARSGVWVAQGCRADFRVIDGGYGDDRYGNGYGYGYGNQGYGGGYGYGGYPYAYSGYDDGGCYVVQRRVWSPYGWTVRPVQICN